MLFAFLEIMAEWTIPYIIMFSIVFMIMRFGFSIKHGFKKSSALFLAGLLLTASFDFAYAMMTGGAQLVDGEPVAGLIPNVFSVPFLASAAVLFGGTKLWKTRQEGP